MVAEALGLLYIGWIKFGLAANADALYTFSFLTLLYFAVFSIISARERRSFWKTRPSKPLVLALVADVMIGTALTFVGIPGLTALPWQQILMVFAYSLASCLAINDTIKALMIRWFVFGRRQ